MRIIPHHTTLIHRNNAPAHGIDDHFIVGGEEDRSSQVIYPLQDLDDIVCIYWVEVPRRFVGNKHIWLVDQRAGYRHPLLLSPRELVREIPYLFGESHELQDVRYIRADVLVTLPCNFERKGDVLVDIFCGQKAEILKDRADITPKLQEVLLGETRYLLFSKKNRPLRWEYFGKQHFEEGRLACA